MVNKLRLGIFGGTFDPPHIGHLILAAEALDQLQLDRVLWVITQTPPHKLASPITPLVHRLDMVVAAIGDDPAFEISRVDIDRPPPHYAVDTMKLLAEEYPKADLIFLMGGDSLNNLPSWYHPVEFIQGCQAIGVMKRPGTHIDLDFLERLLPEITAKIKFVQAPLLDIAATEIRERIRIGQAFRYFLPPAVFKIIMDLKLYCGGEKQY